jgi:G3E family GTPase
LRSKGILAIEGEAERYVIQGVHMLIDGGFLGPWLDGEPHRSRLVLIGRNLDERELQRGFEACSSAS